MSDLELFTSIENERKSAAAKQAKRSEGNASSQNITVHANLTSTCTVSGMPNDGLLRDSDLDVEHLCLNQNRASTPEGVFEDGEDEIMDLNRASTPEHGAEGEDGEDEMDVNRASTPEHGAEGEDGEDEMDLNRASTPEGTGGALDDGQEQLMDLNRASTPEGAFEDGPEEEMDVN
jgi:hypothetical protein